MISLLTLKSDDTTKNSYHILSVNQSLQQSISTQSRLTVLSREAKKEQSESAKNKTRDELLCLLHAGANVIVT